MSTTVSHEGKVRSVTDLPEENWLKHRDVIIAWCNGAEVEFEVPVRRKWRPAPEPDWRVEYDYRIAQRKPQPGEVWIYKDKDNVDAFVITHNLHLVTISGNRKGMHFNDVHGVEYAAPSVMSYIAQKILDQVDLNGMADEQAYQAHNLLISAAKESTS